MKRLFKYVLVITLCVFSICLFGCDNDTNIDKVSKKYNEYFETSLNKSKQVTLDYAVSDNDVVVYDSLVKVKFYDQGCDVSVKESKLNSKYVLESDENSYTETEYNRKDYVNVKFDSQYFRSFELNDDLKLSVKKFYFCDFIGIEDLPINSIAEVTVNNKDGNIDTIVASFISDSDKDVTITISFGY